jgi:CHAT domain-containing protein
MRLIRAFTITILATLLVPSVLSQSKDLTEGIKLRAKGDSCLFSHSDIASAASYYQKAHDFFVKNKNRDGIAATLSDMASIAVQSFNFTAATRQYKDILRKYPSVHDSVSFHINQTLFGIYALTQQIDSAAYYESKCEALLVKGHNLVSLDIVDYNNSQSMKSMAEMDIYKQEAYLLKSLKILKGLKSDSRAAFYLPIIYNNLAYCYLQQQEYAAAKSYFQQALITNKDAICYFNLAECHLQLNEFDQAFAAISTGWNYYTHLVKHNPKQRQLPSEEYYYRALGSYYSKIGSFEKAIASYRATIELKPKITNTHLYNAYLGLAEIYTARKQYKEVLSQCQQVLIHTCKGFNSANIYQNPNIEQVKEMYAFVHAIYRKTKAFQQLSEQTHQVKDFQSVINCATIAIQVVDQYKRQANSVEAKIFLSDGLYTLYENAMEAAYQLNILTQKPIYQRLFFEYYERSRAMMLSEALKNANLKPRTIPGQLLEEEKRLSQQISSLKQKIQQSDSLAGEVLKTQMADKEIRLNALVNRYEKEYPAYYKLKYDTKIATVATAQQQLLTPDAALIQYFVSERKLFTMVVTRENSKIFAQSIDSTFRKTLLQFQKQLGQNPGGKTFRGFNLSAQLYNQLITPIIPQIQTKKRLIIVRDSELNHLPFEALKPKNGSYLLHQYTISYGYSLGLLLDKNKTITQNDIIAIAPFTGSNLNKSVLRNAPLVPLPASEEEVRQIGGDVYVEKEATKKRFLEQYREHGIIHFATHALTDDKDPMRSFVAFYPDGQEYRLFTNELYDLDLKEAQLVVLSACETGAGRLQRGEGVMSLARAFAYAGAQSVATTLWNANDEATAYISTHFHEYINDGLSLDEALQRAKLDFLKSDLGRRYDHPYYWANMVLIGRTDPISVGTSWWWFVVGGLILVLGVGGLLKYRGTTQKSQLR